MDALRQSPVVTIGIVVPVPEPYAGRVQRARSRYGDPLADLIRTHITLVGPHPVTADRLPSIEEHLATVAARHAPYRVVLDGTDTFRPVTQVVYLKVTEGAQACREIAEDLGAGPVGLESAFPYHPHVTLVHDVPQANLDSAQRELAGEHIEFVVDSIGLYLLGADGYWRPALSVTLTGPR